MATASLKRWLNLCLPLLVFVLALPWTKTNASAQGSRSAPARPKLIVVLVVDQLRAAYLTDYADHFSAGLKRLMRDGAWFQNAAYPYLNTVTCAGHSTIGTGTFPYQHGMILNAWLDRETGSSPACTDDPAVRDISYNGLPPGQGDSAKRMLRPALGEQVLDRGGRSVALSLKPRSAIPLTGHKTTAVLWFDERGGWSTSSAFTKEPVAWLQDFINANPIAADFDKVWDRTLDPSAYRFTDDAEGEGRAGGWSRTFPHPLGTPGGKPDAAFYSRWQRSPFADEYLERMGAAAIDALQLGRANATDFLAVSFSTLDLVGHAYGPRSHEVQDVLVRLDRTIERLLAHLDEKVGRGNYVLALSADHGVADVPEQVHEGGRQPGKVAADALTKALTQALGPGNHVASSNYTDIYLSAEARTKVRSDAALRKVVIDTLAGLPAIARVFAGEDLGTAAARASSDPVMKAAALSYHAGRSGDFVIVPKEQWLLASSVTTHGTLYSYDQRVPVILFGAAVKAGNYSTAASPADIAPTLAAVAGVSIAQTDGRVLKEALRP